MCLSGTSSPLTRTPARAGALLFLSLFSLSCAKSPPPFRATPCVTLVALEVSAPESVHSSLRSFSFRDVSYDLLFNHATGSKYSFATNFHLHVSSLWACLVPQTMRSFSLVYRIVYTFLFLHHRLVLHQPKVVARELKGFQDLEF